MTNSRFPWSRATREEQVDQLKRVGYPRQLATDSPLQCVVCRSKPKHGEHVLYPSKGCGPDNRIIAHTACVETAYKAAQANRQSEAVALGLKPLTVPVHANPISSPQLAHPADPLAQLAKIRQEIYNEGYNAGIKAALAQLQGLTDEHSPRIN
jgi:hypothetical protein